MSQLDQMWIIICALFVFFMQAGFICFEVGLIQPKNVISVAIENIIAFVIATLSFFAVGYAIMFGPSFHGLFGSKFWFGSHLGPSTSYGLLLFELMFAGTAVTIFSGSLSERTKMWPLMIAAVVVGAIIYPVYGHWVWGGLYQPQNVWLASKGFIDFAGATVVHATAGWVALAGILVVGPRKDRWDEQGKKRRLGRSNIPFAALGIFILWFSWFGFNGGSSLAFSEHIGLILINTNLAASAGVIGAVVTVFFFFKDQSYMEAIFTGALGGLVAITAGSNLTTPLGAFTIGLITGAVVIMGTVLLEQLKIDDAVGAVPIHAFGGVSGSLLIAWFTASDQRLSERLAQFWVQLTGVGVNFIWAFGMAMICFKLLDHFFGLRVTPEEENVGLNVVEFDDLYTWEQALKERSFVSHTEALNVQIAEQNEELIQYAKRLIATQEQERVKIARDLHDSVGQLLAATKLDMGMLSRSLVEQQQQQQAGRILSLVDQTVEEIRSVIFNLKPVQLEQHGLEQSLKALCEQLEKIAKVRIRLILADSLPIWDETVTLNVFRIVQECLNNAIKHSEASNVEVFGSSSKSSASQGGTYEFLIKDNGKGFNPDMTTDGFGMTTMKERMTLIKGSIAIVSRPAGGTYISLEVPYDTH